MPTVLVSSRQADGFEGSPAKPQRPPGQALAPPPAPPHGPPSLVPPLQRRPPQTVAPTATQSALLLHAVAAPLLQVSQRHFVPEPSLQFGLLAVSVLVTGSVL